MAIIQIEDPDPAKHKAQSAKRKGTEALPCSVNIAMVMAPCLAV
jgi:hypothetical protein